MLAGILLVGAGVCLFYYIMIIVYSGIGTAAAFLWPLLAGVLAASALGVRYYQRCPGKTFLWIPVSLLTLCVAGGVVLTVVQILIFGRVEAVATPGLDYVIVLGAKVNDDGLSRTLVRRLNKAMEYADQNPDTILILSGGKGDDEPISEAEAMYGYLVEHGIPKEQLRMEIQSTSTLENIAYSSLLIDADRQKRREMTGAVHPEISGDYIEAPEKPLSIGVVTSNFHVYRALAIAKKRGFDSLEGIASGTDPVLFVHYCLRECAAILKDRLVGNI